MCPQGRVDTCVVVSSSVALRMLLVVEMGGCGCVNMVGSGGRTRVEASPASAPPHVFGNLVALHGSV